MLEAGPARLGRGRGHRWVTRHARSAQGEGRCCTLRAHGREDTMIAVAVLARQGNEDGETVEEFERGEFDDGAPVTVGFGEEVAHRWDGACSRLIARVVVPAQAPACEWGPGAVPKEALKACAVARADAHTRVEREASRVMPGAHPLDDVP